MTTRADYGIRKRVQMPHAEALQKAREVLASEGFGVLCEIDIQAKLKEKLGVDFQPYVILGACNPPLAHEALQAEPEIGLLLPCNVIVYQEGDGCVVAAIDPDAMMSVAGPSDRLKRVAADARMRLERAIAAL